MTNKHIYLAGGCFWGTEHFFKQIAGVVETEVGFANGQTDNPTYEQVYTDTTGYAETVHVTYDPDKVCLEFLLHMFFVAIDPTSLNKPIASQRKVLNYTPNLPAKRSSNFHFSTFPHIHVGLFSLCPLARHLMPVSFVR